MPAAKYVFQPSTTIQPLRPPPGTLITRSMPVCTLWNSFVEYFHVDRPIRGWSTAVVRLSMYVMSSANSGCAVTVLRRVRPIPTLLTKVISPSFSRANQHKPYPGASPRRSGPRGEDQHKPIVAGVWFGRSVYLNQESVKRSKIWPMALSRRRALAGLDPGHCENEFDEIVFGRQRYPFHAARSVGKAYSVLLSAAQDSFET